MSVVIRTSAPYFITSRLALVTPPRVSDDRKNEQTACLRRHDIQQCQRYLMEVHYSTVRMSLENPSTYPLLHLNLIPGSGDDDRRGSSYKPRSLTQ